MWLHSSVSHPIVDSCLNPPAAFLEPLMLTKDTIPKGSEKIFPNIQGEEILASSKTIPIHYFAKSERLLIRVPFSSIEGYISWLNRVQEAKAQNWMNSGMFEVIQFSRHPIEMEPSMLGVSLFFWNKTANNFHLPYRMIGPTLFDVSAITGL